MERVLSKADNPHYIESGEIKKETPREVGFVTERKFLRYPKVFAHMRLTRKTPFGFLGKIQGEDLESAGVRKKGGDADGGEDFRGTEKRGRGTRRSSPCLEQSEKGSKS